jgi:zinc and cadmium transporter
LNIFIKPNLFLIDMVSVWFYAIGSVILVSLISLAGLSFFALRKQQISAKTLLLLVSLSVGTLIGGAFLHLLPEAVEKNGFGIDVSLAVLAGFVVFYILESFVHLHHSDVSGVKKSKKKSQKHNDNKHALKHHHHHAYHLGIMNLVGDGVHNFIDGLVIAGSYFVSIPVGIATTIAVIVHEIPQEMADFGVLLYSGLSRMRALFYNLGSAVLAIVGAIVGLLIGNESSYLATFLLPFAAGGFIYIAAANLIPELQNERGLKSSVTQLGMIVLGIGLMVGLLYLEVGA